MVLRNTQRNSNRRDHMASSNQKQNALFEEIAKEHFFVETLETRGLDRLDFHDVSVACIKSALEAAFEAGRAAGEATNKAKATRESKQNTLIQMMKRPEGATINQMAEATGWKPNTVRGTLSGTLKKRLGLTIATERDSNNDPDAKGSHLIYRIQN